jgi:hypothetical protein
VYVPGASDAKLKYPRLSGSVLRGGAGLSGLLSMIWAPAIAPKFTSSTTLPVINPWVVCEDKSEQLKRKSKSLGANEGLTASALNVSPKLACGQHGDCPECGLILFQSTDNLAQFGCNPWTALLFVPFA